MNISWGGKTFFLVSVQKNKNANIELAIEPFNDKEIKTKMDIVIEKKGTNPTIKGKSFTVSGPGEYEIEGVFIQNVDDFFYLIEAEGIVLCHLGNYVQKEVSADYLEIMNKADILIIPIEESNGLDSKTAVKLVREIEPKIVLPVNSGKEKENGVANFLKEMGIKDQGAISKLNIKGKEFLSKEGMEVVILDAKS